MTNKVGPLARKYGVIVEKCDDGSWDVLSRDGICLFNVWRPYVTPSRWMAGIGNAGYTFGTRREAIEFGVSAYRMHDYFNKLGGRPTEKCPEGEGWE